MVSTDITVSDDIVSDDITVSGDIEALMDKHYGYLRDAVDKLELWNCFDTVNPPENKGYMFWNHDNLKNIQDELGDKMSFHSGASWGVCLRKIQNEAKNNK